MARILIAEDEEPVRTLVARALAQDGHEVMTAADGAAALDVLAREAGNVALLLSDIRMPGMDGIALAHATARHHPNVAILLMTGFADQRERAHDIVAVVHDVVSKPFSLNEIRQAVRRALAAGKCDKQ
jgi:two-component system, cell cycle response regulator CpdR